MIQVLYNRSGQAGTADAAVALLSPVSVQQVVVANADTPVAVAGTLSNLQIHLLAGAGSTSRTWTVYKNGVATSLAVTLTSGQTTGSDTSNTVTVAAGDLIRLQRTSTGSAGDTADMLVRTHFEATAAKTTIYAFGTGGDGALPRFSTGYTSVIAGGQGDGTTEALQSSLCSAAGDFTALTIKLTGAPGAGRSFVFTLMLNGVAQDGTIGTPDTRITIADAATSGSSAFTLPVAQLDLISLRVVPSGSPASVGYNGSLAFVANTDGQRHVSMNSADPLTGGTTTEYHWPNAGTFQTPYVWGATESGRTQRGASTTLTLSSLYARLNADPGSGKSFTFTLRKNGADTAQTITLDSANWSGASAVAASVDIEDGDTWAIAAVPSGSPGASHTAKATFVAVVPTIRGSFVAGENTTVNVSRATAWGLDGATNVHDEEGVHKIFGASSVTEYVEQAEMASAPAAASGATKKVRIWAEDSGGKTRWMAQFATGSPVQLSIEP